MPEAKRRRVTAADVAKQAGVSRSAVSRAFTEGSYLDPVKRSLILDAAHDLGYRPNALAAGLSGAKSNLVAIFAGEMPNELDRDTVAALVTGLNSAGKWPIVVGGSGEVTRDAISNVLRYPLEAMILRAGSLDADIVESCGKLNVPVISMGRVVQQHGVDSVCCRNRDGAAIGAQLLMDRERRRFGFIGGPDGFTSSADRRQGLADALSQNGLSLICEATGDYTVQGGFDAANRLLAARSFDALVCANDAMAIGALTALQASGLRIPEDASLIGFDDIPMAAWPTFRLTTLRNPVPDLVSAVLEVLARRIDNPTKAAETIMLDADLVLRDTH